MNLTDFVVTLGESINWTSTIIGIAGGIFGIYIWFYDRKNMRKATLYFPLFFACQGIIDVINNPDTLGATRSRSLYALIAKTLDDIIYEHGSIIHLKNGEDMNTFFSMKKTIDENLEFIEKKHWTALKDKFKSKEFTELEIYAKVLLSKCKEEVKEFKKIPE